MKIKLIQFLGHSHFLMCFMSAVCLLLVKSVDFVKNVLVALVGLVLCDRIA